VFRGLIPAFSMRAMRGKDLSRARVVVRMNHASGATAVTGEAYDRIVALSREFSAANKRPGRPSSNPLVSPSAVSNAR